MHKKTQNINSQIKFTCAAFVTQYMLALISSQLVFNW